MLIEARRTAREAVENPVAHTELEASDARKADLFSPEALHRQFACFPVDDKNPDAGYCAVIETAADFQRLQPLWRAFEAAQPNASLFASWDWVWNWWQDFGRHPHDGIGASRPFIVAVLSPAHALRGLLPFHLPVCRPDARGLRVLRLFGCLGKHHEAMTEEPPLLLQAGLERQTLAAALHFLLREQTRRAWDLIELWVDHAEPSPPPPRPGPVRRSCRARCAAACKRASSIAAPFPF